MGSNRIFVNISCVKKQRSRILDSLFFQVRDDDHHGTVDAVPAMDVQQLVGVVGMKLLNVPMAGFQFGRGRYGIRSTRQHNSLVLDVFVVPSSRRSLQIQMSLDGSKDGIC